MPLRGSVDTYRYPRPVPITVPSPPNNSSLRETKRKIHSHNPSGIPILLDGLWRSAWVAVYNPTLKPSDVNRRIWGEPPPPIFTQAYFDSGHSTIVRVVRLRGHQFCIIPVYPLWAVSIHPPVLNRITWSVLPLLRASILKLPIPALGSRLESFQAMMPSIATSVHR